MLKMLATRRVLENTDQNHGKSHFDRLFQKNEKSAEITCKTSFSPTFKTLEWRVYICDHNRFLQFNAF